MDLLVGFACAAVWGRAIWGVGFLSGLTSGFLLGFLAICFGGAAFLTAVLVGLGAADVVGFAFARLAGLVDARLTGLVDARLTGLVTFVRLATVAVFARTGFVDFALLAGLDFARLVGFDARLTGLVDARLVGLDFARLVGLVDARLVGLANFGDFWGVADLAADFAGTAFLLWIKIRKGREIAIKAIYTASRRFGIKAVCASCTL